MGTFYFAPSVNYKQTTINGSITSGQTTITLNSTANMTAPGYVVIDRQDSAGNNTPNSREVVSYTGISSNDLTGCTRGADNSSALAHNNNALVETMPTVGMWNSLVSAIRTFTDANGYFSPLASPASIQQLTSDNLFVKTRLDVSGASVSGIARTFVWNVPAIASTATSNVQRIAAPFGGTFRSFTLLSSIPGVSAASVTVTVFAGTASVFSQGTRPALFGGSTYASTASILNPNFTAGQILRMDVDNAANQLDLTLEGIAY